MTLITSSAEGKKTPDTEFLLYAGYPSFKLVFYLLTTVRRGTINQTRDSGGLSIAQCKSYFDKLHVAQEKTKLAELMKTSDRCSRLNVEMQNIKAAVKSPVSDIKNDKPSLDIAGAADNLLDLVKATAADVSTDHIQAVSVETITMNNVRAILPPDMTLYDIDPEENYIGPVFASTLEDLSHEKIEHAQVHHNLQTFWTAQMDDNRAESAQRLEDKKMKMTNLEKVIAKKNRKIRDLEAQLLEDNDTTSMDVPGTITAKDCQINYLEAQLRDASSIRHNEMHALRQEHVTAINGKINQIHNLKCRLEEAHEVDDSKDKQISDLRDDLNEAQCIADRKDDQITALRDRLDEARTISHSKEGQICDLSNQVEQAHAMTARANIEVSRLQYQLYHAHAIARAPAMNMRWW